MGRGKLTKEEMKILVENPYVVEVNEQRIVYSEEFKRYFMQNIWQGKGLPRFSEKQDLIKK